MNTRELCLSVQTQLLARKWNGSGEKVFSPGAVLVTLGIDTEVVHRLRLPAALIRPFSGSIDPDHKQETGILKRQIAIRVISSVAGDPWGEGALIGACRPSVNSSDGAGLLEIEEEIWAAVGILNALESVNLLFVANSAPKVEWVDGSKIAVGAEYLFEATVTAAASS